MHKQNSTRNCSLWCKPARSALSRSHGVRLYPGTLSTFRAVLRAERSLGLRRCLEQGETAVGGGKAGGSSSCRAPAQVNAVQTRAGRRLTAGPSSGLPRPARLWEPAGRWRGSNKSGEEGGRVRSGASLPPHSSDKWRSARTARVSGRAAAAGLDPHRFTPPKCGDGRGLRLRLFI